MLGFLGISLVFVSFRIVLEGCQGSVCGLCNQAVRVRFLV